MKKLLTLTALSAILTAPALAVQKCVALGASSTTCSPWSADQDSIEWYSRCTTGSTTVEIIGEGICFADSKYTSFDFNADNNHYCHCRVVSPVRSGFVLGETFTNWSECISRCASACADLDISAFGGRFYE